MLAPITLAARRQKLLVKEPCYETLGGPVTFSSSALEYIGNIILNLLVVASAILLAIGRGTPHGLRAVRVSPELPLLSPQKGRFK